MQSYREREIRLRLHTQERISGIFRVYLSELYLNSRVFKFLHEFVFSFSSASAKVFVVSHETYPTDSNNLRSTCNFLHSQNVRQWFHFVNMLV